jgi:hypothetical protein
MTVPLLIFSMLTLLWQPQIRPRHLAEASRPQNTAIQAIRAVKLHAPTRSSPTLGRHFADLEQAARANNSPIMNAWRAERSGKAWIVTLVTSPGDVSENTARWKVTLRPTVVSPLNRVARNYEAALRSGSRKR